MLTKQQKEQIKHHVIEMGGTYTLPDGVVLYPQMVEIGECKNAFEHRLKLLIKVTDILQDY